jgi:hypothetical protein
MTVHELSQLVLEWIWARPKPLHKSIIGQCVKLEGLAIDLPKADMGPLKGLGADFMLRHNNVRDKKPKTKLLEAFLVSND